MKKIALTFLFFLNFYFPVFSQLNSKDLPGMWEYIGDDNQQSKAECPEFIYFEPNGSYTISNDCYGEDIENPVIEKGTYIFDPKTRKIKFNNRKFYSNYRIYGPEQKLTFTILELTPQQLKIKEDAGKREVEVFKKVVTKP